MSRLGVFLSVYVLTHRTSSFRFGRFPVIRIPTLYILAAIQVTAPMPTPSSASDMISSLTLTLPAAQRTGMAIGDVNGTSDNATAYGEPGSFASANTDR